MPLPLESVHWSLTTDESFFAQQEEKDHDHGLSGASSSGGLDVASPVVPPPRTDYYHQDPVCLLACQAAEKHASVGCLLKHFTSEFDRQKIVEENQDLGQSSEESSYRGSDCQQLFEQMLRGSVPALSAPASHKKWFPWKSAFVDVDHILENRISNTLTLEAVYFYPPRNI
jgi:hypothetical protein